VRRVVLGPPLRSAAVVQERMRKLVALPVLASDLLSSVAYGPQAMLSVVLLAGSAALSRSLPIAGALVVLMVVAGLSYRQTIPAYPQGAGSYIVAGDNLGRAAGLAAAAGLLTDYVLTVSVSVTSGVDAVTSAVQGMRSQAVLLGLLVIGMFLAANLRGIRQAASLSAAPTYAFVLAVALLVGLGVAQLRGRGFAVTPPPPVPPVEALSLLLVLRAFSSGATSMTGIEAVSNAIPAFKPPEWRNARTTLTWMIALLVVVFGELVMLVHFDGVIPGPDETVLSGLGHVVFGNSLLYGYLQAATALILVVAANTAFNDFPRLLFYMARDCHAQRIFLRMGDRLASATGASRWR
jgi:amino acid transporter